MTGMQAKEILSKLIKCLASAKEFYIRFIRNIVPACAMSLIQSIPSLQRILTEHNAAGSTA